LRWIHLKHDFFLPVKVLSRVFRGKFVAGLKRLFRRKKLSFHGNLKHLSRPSRFQTFLRQLFRQDRVVYAKPPFGGPEYGLIESPPACTPICASAILAGGLPIRSIVSQSESAAK
jgi:hypothetical protein